MTKAYLSPEDIYLLTSNESSSEETTTTFARENTLLDDMKALASILESPLNTRHKIPSYGKLYPERVYTSSVLCTYLFCLHSEGS